MARLEDLPPLEAAAVLMLRVCCDAALEGAPPSGLGNGGPEAAAFAAFSDLVSAAVAGARRPLARHAAHCVCVGADENAIARLVAAAAEGEREEAMQIALVVARPDRAPEIAALAERAGLGLRRVAVRLGRGASGGTLH